MIGVEKMAELIALCCILLTIFFAVKCLAMKISVIALGVWLERNICKQPMRKELDECKNLGWDSSTAFWRDGFLFRS